MTTTREKNEEGDGENGATKVDGKTEKPPAKRRAATDETCEDWIQRTEELQLRNGLTANPAYSPTTKHPSLQPPPKRNKKSPPSFPTIGKQNENQPGTQTHRSTTPGSAELNARDVLVQHLDNLVETEIEKATPLLDPPFEPAKYEPNGILQDDMASLNMAAARKSDEGDKKPAAKRIGSNITYKYIYKPPGKLISQPNLRPRTQLLLTDYHQIDRVQAVKSPVQICSPGAESIAANNTAKDATINNREFTEEAGMEARHRSALQSSNVNSRPGRYKNVTPCRFLFPSEIIEIESDTEQSPHRNNAFPDKAVAKAEDVDVNIENYRQMGLTTVQSPETTRWEARMDKALQVNIPPRSLRVYLQKLLKAPPGTNFSTVAFSVPPHTKFEVIPPSSTEQHQSLQWLYKNYTEDVHPHTFYDDVSISTHLASQIPAIMDIKLKEQDKTGACLVHKRHQYDSMVVQALLHAVPFLVRYNKRRATTKILTLYKFDSTKLNHLIKQIEMSGWYIAKERTPAVKRVDAGGKQYDRNTEFLYNLLDFAHPVNAQSLYTAESETLWYIPRQIADWVFLFPQQVSETYYENRLQNSFVPPPKANALYSCK